MLKKFLNPTYDICFKKIFGSVANLDTLTKGFLNSSLNLQGDKEITHLELLETIQKPEISSRKESSVDVIVKDQSGDRYIVEMQIAKIEGFEKRAQYYAARVYLNNFNTGGKYNDISKVIFLAIINYTIFPNKKAYKSEHITLDKVTYEHDLKDFAYTFVELPKFNKTIEESKKHIEDSWYYFFKYSDESNEPISDLLKLPHIQHAYDIVKAVNWSEEELNQYERQEMNLMDEKGMIDAAKEEGREEGLEEGHEKGLEKGREEGHEKGREEGLEEGHEKGLEKGREEGHEKGREKGLEEGHEKGLEKGKLEIARNLKNAGIEFDIIAQNTGLSKAKIENL